MDIIGASGHGKVIIDMLQLNQIPIEGVWDDDPTIGEVFMGFPVKGSVDTCVDAGTEHLIIAVGNNAIRKKIAARLSNTIFGVAIHPTAAVAPEVEIGPGTVVMANSSINTGSQVGSHVIINTNASVDHDCTIGDYVHISPQAGLAGGVEIGEGTHIGIGACVIQGIKIGKWCTLGAGAVIIRDVPDGATVVGNPGKVIKR
jgi:acetyltransferase EpsM